MEDGDDEEDEEEEGRLEQQMGDAGEEADDVDERFWDDKDSQENVRHLRYCTRLVIMCFDNGLYLNAEGS